MNEERDILALRQGYLVHKLDFWASNLERNMQESTGDTKVRNDAFAKAYREIQGILLGCDDNHIDSLYAIL